VILVTMLFFVKFFLPAIFIAAACFALAVKLLYEFSISVEKDVFRRVSELDSPVYDSCESSDGPKNIAT
jgi:hypothetical protein